MSVNGYNILIVDNDKLFSLELKNSLIDNSYRVTSIEKTLHGVKKSVKKSFPQLAIVDIDLNGDKNGLVIGEYLHRFNISVIYSTSCSDTDTINKALDTNPVCYLVKPININGLISNIKLALYKKSSDPNFKKKRINRDYSYDLKMDKLFYKGSPIALSKSELLFLKILLNSKTEIVLFKDIEYQLWKSRSVKNSTLRTIVYRLRKKLPNELIKTVPSLGFSLIKT